MDKHEQMWFLNQKARIQNAVERATLIWSDGNEAIDIPSGYYVFWFERETPYHEPARVHQYLGKGDAQTQVNLENWLTQHRKRGS